MATGFDPRVAHAEILRVRTSGGGEEATLDAVAVEEPLDSGAERLTAISGTLGRESLRR